VASIVSAFGSPGIKQSSTFRYRVAPLHGLAQPAVEIGQKTAIKQRVGEKTSTTIKATTIAKPKVRKEQEIEDAPMYKVMLLGDEEYNVAHVVPRLCELMEDMDENMAGTVFKSAQVSGRAMCGKYPLEHAELYVEQLIRSDPMIFAELEDADKV
jgi:ATP-dependent Clp protease adapter protein ClpS